MDAENPTATPDGWIVYSQGGTSRLGIWKIHPDGSGATRIVAQWAGRPETSPNGRYVSYVVGLRGSSEVRVARLEDGRPTPFQINMRLRGGSNDALIGRTRWMPDGKTIVFSGHEESGPYGLYSQGFDPSRNTSATLKRLAGFDPDVQLESFGISPDGSRMIVGAYEQLSSLLIAERVPGIPPRRTAPR